MLHAGVLKKFGLYGLLRVALPLLPQGAQQWSTLLIVLLLGNIIYVGLVTIAQKRLDWMLGYSSVMHMGYIFLGIASGTLLGANGAAILIFAHGISIALLFGITGEIRQRTGTLFLSDLGGFGKVMPRAALAFGLAAFASIGLPGFANFAGEVMVLFGTFHHGANPGHFTIFQVATVLALWGVVISAVYMLRAYRKVFMGALRESLDRPDRSSPEFAHPDWNSARPLALVRILSPILCPDRFAHLQKLLRSKAMTIGTPILEVEVLIIGLFLLIMEAFFERIDKRTLAYTGIFGLAAVLAASFFLQPAPMDVATTGFWSFYTSDPLAIFFKRFALVTTILVLVMMVDYAPVVRESIHGATHQSGLGEFFALPIFTCVGLMWMASAIDFVMIFVSLELVTMSFYVLVAFTRRNPATLEAGVKYLILSAFSTGFLVYGITWIFGVTGETNLARVTTASISSGD